MNETQNKWNERWQEKADDSFDADPWLLRIFPLLPAGSALDLASGRGRNALFLAEHGLSVTAFDISEEALAQLGLEAARRRLAVCTRQIDLEADPQLPGDAYDLVLDFFYLHRPLLPQLQMAVRPGGVAVLRTFSSAGSFPGGPGDPAFVLQPGELLDIFAGWEILLHEEGLEPSRKGGSLAGIVARRPAGD
jgi:tellurite methyltransferase